MVRDFHKPKVSVIIPAYNGDRFIIQAVESVLNQTYKNYEIIVIDDGSVDNIRQVLEAYLQKINYIFQRNQGVASARNLGIQEAEGDYIAFLDQDDYFLPEKLAKQVAILENNPQIGMVHSGWERVNDSGEKIGEVKPWEKSPQLTLKEWVEKKPILLSAMLFRRDWLKKVDGLDTHFRQACDIDLILRLSLAGCEAVWLKEITFCYREHDRNDSLNTPLQVQESLAVNEKFFNLPGVPQSILKIKNHCFYFNYVWSAWRLYLTDHLDLMSEYLAKSLEYTPFSPEETVMNWLQEFSINYQEHTQKELDIYHLTHHPIWQDLIKKKLPNLQLTLVSVIIPVYNGQTYIKAAIQSVLNQTYPAYEIIVIDDGSTDQTRQVLQAYGDKIKYIYQGNQGVAVARNRGIQEAQGELIAFLDQDDYFLPNKLALQVTAFTKKKHLGIVNSGWRNVNKKGELLAETTLWKDLPVLNLVGWILWKPVFPGAMMFRRQWLEKAGGFDPNYQQSPDVDLVLRLVGMGCEADWVKEVTVCYRQHDRNTSRNTPQQVKELEQVLDNFFTNYNFPEIDQKLEYQCRYNSLVWAAGRLYYHGYANLMGEYLRKSLQYTPFDSNLETWTDWGEQIYNNLRDFGTNFHPLDWVNSPEWREITQEVLPKNCPLVSVIIPTYNNQAYLAEAIDSVLSQTYPFYEIIVIDDGSTDNTQEILKTYKDRIFTVYQKNQGVSVARNRGLEIAQGQFIAFLDGDDYFLPYKLATQLTVFEKNPHLGIVHSGWYMVTETGEILAHQKPWYELRELDLKAWVLWRAVLPSAMMIRREWLEKVGGFQPGLAYAEDVELIVRLAQAGCQAIWLEKITVNYRLHQTNATTASKTPLQAQCFDQFYNQFFSQPNLPPEIRQIESRSRYNYYIWMAWRFFETGYYQKMQEYLRKSLEYPQVSTRGTIIHWVGFFRGYSEGKGIDFDGNFLITLPEWQQLVKSILPKEKPKVSVIIPTYNSSKYIIQAIESVANQTYGNWEIIVVDDGSMDDTKNRLSGYLDVIHYIYQNNQGVSCARNRGIQEAQGELIAFLDADDYFLPHKITDQVAYFDRDPSLGIVNSGWRMVDEMGTEISDITMWESCPELALEDWLLWKPVLPSSLMISRQWLEKVKGFNTTLSSFEDIDLIWRMAAMGCESIWLKKITVCYRQHRQSTTSQSVSKMAEGYEIVFNNFFRQKNLPEAIKRLESEARYKSLLWLAWQFYQAKELTKMVEYLEESCQHSPYSGLRMVFNWLDHFSGYGFSYGYSLDTYKISQLPEWQKLVENVMDNSHLLSVDYNDELTLSQSVKNTKISRSKNPKVSVIIPSYNTARFVVEAVESVLNQTYKDYEILVIDDGSTDNTQEVLEPYKEKIHYIYQPNQGAAIARNHGCRLARGEFLAFLDADDYFFPEKLAAQIACFDDDPSLEMIQNGWRLVNQNGEKISDVTLWEAAPELDLKSWVIYKMVRPSAMMLRREWWEKVGGFDHRYPPTEDLDFALRLCLMGCKMKWLKEVYTGYRQHDSNLMSSGYKLMKNTEIIMEEFFARPELPEEIRQLRTQERYLCTVWMAWRMYYDRHFPAMADALIHSLEYTPFSPTETIANWLETFRLISQEYNFPFDLYQLTQLEEWQNVLFAVLNTPAWEVGQKARNRSKLVSVIPSKRTHILFYNTDEPGVGGMAQYDHTMICELARLGYQVSIARPRHSSPLLAQEKELGIHQIWLDFNGSSHFSRVLKNLRDAEKLFDQVNPDLIVFSDGWPIANFAAKQVALKKGIPYIITLGLAQPDHGDFTQGDGISYVEIMRYIWMQAQAVVTAAQDHLNILHKQFRLPPDPLQKVIYCGRPEIYFNPPNLETRQRLRQSLGIPDDGIICFTSARLAAVKGHRHQIAAIKELKNTPIWSKLYFVWAGTGAGSFDDVEEELKAEIKALGVTDHVFFIGQRWDIIDWLDAVDIFVLTSHADAAPTFAIIEAMAKGIPIIAGAAGGIPEGLGNTGKLLPDPNKNSEKTVSELVKAIQALAVNSGLRKSMGEACKKRAEELFTEGRMVEEFAEVVQRSLNPQLQEQKAIQLLDTQAKMEKFKNPLKYSHLVCQAWLEYCDQNHDQMIAKLRESIDYTPLLGTETILYWLGSFTKFAEESHQPFDPSILTHTPEWSELVERVLGLAVA